jgi:hypothetical protein
MVQFQETAFSNLCQTGLGLVAILWLRDECKILFLLFLRQPLFVFLIPYLLQQQNAKAVCWPQKG